MVCKNKGLVEIIQLRSIDECMSYFNRYVQEFKQGLENKIK